MDFDFTIRDLGALTIFASAVGAVIGFILLAWLKVKLGGVFVQHTDLEGVKGEVATVRGEVAGVKGQVAQVSAQVEELREEVHALPSNQDLSTVRHDVKGLLQGQAALGAAVQGQRDQLQGIDERLQMVLDTLLRGAKR